MSDNLKNPKFTDFTELSEKEFLRKQGNFIEKKEFIKESAGQAVENSADASYRKLNSK